MYDKVELNRDRVTHDVWVKKREKSWKEAEGWHLLSTTGDVCNRRFNNRGSALCEDGSRRLSQLEVH